MWVTSSCSTLPSSILENWKSWVGCMNTVMGKQEERVSMPILDIRMWILTNSKLFFLFLNTSFTFSPPNFFTNPHPAFHSFVWEKPKSQDKLPHISLHLFWSPYSFYCLWTQDRRGEWCRVRIAASIYCIGGMYNVLGGKCNVLDSQLTLEQWPSKTTPYCARQLPLPTSAFLDMIYLSS